MIFAALTQISEVRWVQYIHHHTSLRK